MPKWLNDQQVSERYGWSKATTWRKAKQGLIPGPVKIGGQTRWNADELDAHDATLIATRDGEAA
ncbi:MULTISPECIES: helix-turn-helix transcriptional regulator [Ruegeria]|uniref:Putative transcriptional regulator n=1 Tax=Ruegeria atlantica TaxID=81569 RepID=A0A0P1EYA7_9RHOB|nr:MULTISPECIES: helix-turn-helix domain-containing protein [Ruegeria]CUH45859.1 putative transcriptional regulator [Ruegeria atlantica]